MIGIASIIFGRTQTKAQPVGGPALNPTAKGKAIHVRGCGRVFVLNNQIDHLIAAGVGLDQIAVNGIRQRAVKRDNTLQVVHLVVAARNQAALVHHKPGCCVAHFDQNMFCALRDVLTAQEVDGTAGSLKRLTSGKLIGLGGKKLCRKPWIAVYCRFRRLQLELRAIKRALIADEDVTAQAGLIIAPQEGIIVLLNLEIEVPRRRRVVIDFAVVAKGRIAVLRVDAFQHAAGVFFVQSAEDVFQLFLAGVER